MMKKIVLMMALLTVVSGVALAADIDGRWIAEVQGRAGNTQTQTLTLKASGSTLTGSLNSGRGAVDISEGTIDGKKVSFKVVRQFNGNPVTQQYKGALSGTGELTLTVSGSADGRGGPGGRGGATREMIFKKAG